ncbi:hypothetical protein HDV05_000358, partial [Chytridiales sp. JEL 0842]
WGVFTTPFFAIVNQAVGAWIILWLVLPLMYTQNAFGADMSLGNSIEQGPNGTGQFPLRGAINSPVLFDKDGTSIMAYNLFKTFSDGRLELDQDYYDQIKPVRITTYFALTYGMYFLGYTAVLTHFVVWHGKDAWERCRKSLRNLDADDANERMMDSYPEVPRWLYVALLCITLFGLGIPLALMSPFGLNIPLLLLAISIAAAFLVPIAIIESLSSTRIQINVLAELIIGYIQPGNPLLMMSFKTISVSTLDTALDFLTALKMGEYLKIPPRALVTTHLFATTYAILIQLLTVEVLSPLLIKLRGGALGEGPTGWSAENYTNFISASAIWGGIGPARFLGSESPYSSLRYFFLVGLVLPIIPWALHRYTKKSFWALINVPLLAALPGYIGTPRSDLITPIVVAWFFNKVLR